VLLDDRRAAINNSLKRAQRSGVGLRVAIERQRKDGLSVSESVPNLREGARRLAELIIGQLREAKRNVEPGEIQELEALIWKKLPNQ
jgi:soluble cytochrome b562